MAPVSGFEVHQATFLAQSGSEEGELPSQVLAVSDSSHEHRLLDQLPLPRVGLGQCES